MFKDFVKLIGEENKERFRNEITDMVLNKMRNID